MKWFSRMDDLGYVMVLCLWWLCIYGGYVYGGYVYGGYVYGGYVYGGDVYGGYVYGAYVLTVWDLYQLFHLLISVHSKYSITNISY